MGPSDKKPKKPVSGGFGPAPSPLLGSPPSTEPPAAPGKKRKKGWWARHRVGATIWSAVVAVVAIIAGIAIPQLWNSYGVQFNTSKVTVAAVTLGVTKNDVVRLQQEVVAEVLVRNDGAAPADHCTTKWVPGIGYDASNPLHVDDGEYSLKPGEERKHTFESVLLVGESGERIGDNLTMKITVTCGGKVFPPGIKRYTVNGPID